MHLQNHEATLESVNKRVHNMLLKGSRDYRKPSVTFVVWTRDSALHTVEQHLFHTCISLTLRSDVRPQDPRPQYITLSYTKAYVSGQLPLLISLLLPNN